MVKENQYKMAKMPKNHLEIINNENYPDLDDNNEVFIHKVPEHKGKAQINFRKPMIHITTTLI